MGYPDGSVRRKHARKRATPCPADRRLWLVTCRLEQPRLDRVVEERPFKVLRQLIAADLVEFGEPPV